MHFFDLGICISIARLSFSMRRTYLENGSRGARIEALIARFRLKQIAGGQFRIILLSAVLNDVDALCRWLGD